MKLSAKTKMQLKRVAEKYKELNYRCYKLLLTL